MRLTSLNLKNFRGFTNLEQSIDLNHDVILLCGRNASGKTSIFDAIELLLTGSIRRLSHVTDLGAVLVNARNPDAAARISLEMLIDGGSRYADALIRKAASPVVKPALNRMESDLFQHITYLQQSDIRRLVVSDATSLGDVIGSLALDDNVFRLEHALAAVGISRSARSYVNVTRRLGMIEQEGARLQNRLDELSSMIVASTVTSPDYRARNATLQRVVAKLSIPTNFEDDQVTSAYLQRLDSLLEERLKFAFDAQRTAEELIRQYARVTDRQKGITGFESVIRDREAQQFQSNRTLADHEGRVATLRAQLAEPQFASTVAEQRLRLIAALEHIQSIPNLDVCPVCDQSFANLTDHISEKILILRTQQSSAERAVGILQADLQDELTAERTLRRRIDELDNAIRNLKADRSVAEGEVEQFLASLGGDLHDVNGLDEA